MAERFFYDIPLVDFKPGTPDVDMNFLKSLADEYKATVEKADAAKEDIINKLGSLNLHQTFSDDYAEYMKNVETQIEQLDTKYQGKMIDRNYKNELSSMIRNIQNDPNLRYMANTSKELFTYEDMVRNKTDYLEYNDPMLGTYKSVLDRAKGAKPRFTATNIYSDVNPNEQIRLMAKDINVQENTEYIFNKELGTVETIDTKTRTSKNITDKMMPVMQSFRGTQAGQQLEREAAWRKKADGTSYTYEELFIERVNGVSKMLEVNNVKKSLSVSPEKEIDLRQQQIDLEAAKLLQDKDQFNKQYALMEKQASNEDRFKIQQLLIQWTTLGFEVDKFNAQILAEYQKNGMEAAIDLMNNRVQGMKNGIYTPGGTAGGGASGGSKPPPLGYNERFQGTGMTAVTPDLPQNAQTAKIKQAADIADAQALDIRKRLTDSNIYSNDEMLQVEMYLNSIGTPNNDALGSKPFTMKYVNASGQQVVASGTLAQAMANDPMLVRYSQAYLEANRTYTQYEDILFDAGVDFWKKFENSNYIDDWVSNGVMTRDLFRSTKYKTAGSYTVDEKMLIEKSPTASRIFAGKESRYFDTPAYVRTLLGEQTVFLRHNYRDLQSIVSSGKDGVIKDEDGFNRTVTVNQAKIAIAKADQSVYNEAMDSDPILREWKKSKDMAISKRFGTQGTVVRGYNMDPKGDDGLANIEAKYTRSLNSSLEALDLYDINTGLPFMSVGGGQISATTSTGQATGGTYSYVQPGIVYLDSTGRLAMQVTLYDIDPSNLKQGQVATTTKATLLDGNSSNIQKVFLEPMFTNVYGPTVGKGIATFFGDNARWVANNIAYANTGQTIHVPYDASTNVIKQADGSYVVINTTTGDELTANSDFQLAEILSRIDYAATATYTPTQIPSVNLDAVQQVQAHIKDLDELLRDYNKADASLPKDVTTTTTTSTSTTTGGNDDLVKKIIFERIFKTVVSDKESGGDPGAVNKVGELLPDGRRLPATSAAGQFQFVPSVWNDKVKEWARDYGKGDNYTIYSPNGDGTYDKAGPNYQDFLKDPAFQEYVMNRALEQYIATYNKLPAEVRNVVGKAEFSVLAHSIGEPTAAAYFKLQAGLITEADLTDKQKMLIPIGEKYLEDINSRLTKQAQKQAIKSQPSTTSQPTPSAQPKPQSKPQNKPTTQTQQPTTQSSSLTADAKLHDKMKGLAKGETVTLANGEVYVKTEPAGKPNPEITDWKQQSESTIIDWESDTHLEGIMNDWLYAVKQSIKEGDLPSQYSEEEIDNGLKTYVMNRLKGMRSLEEPITVSRMLDHILVDAIYDVGYDNYIYSQYMKAERSGVSTYMKQHLVDLAMYYNIYIPWDILKQHPHLDWVPLRVLEYITQADDIDEAFQILEGNSGRMSTSDWTRFSNDFNAMVIAEIEKEKNSK